MARSSAPAPRRYHAFISYSREVDGRLAPALQTGLQRFAKPWYRVRAMRVFRDDANLSANPALWSSICAALDDSEYFILLASRKAAESEWVAKEAEYWLEHRDADRVLITLTDGDLLWAGTEVVWTPTTALPRVLGTAFTEEPRYVDVRWARAEQQLARRDPRLRDAIADLAATLHGRPKDELLGEDLRQHRRALRLVWAAAILLALLAAAATALALVALQERDKAQHERNEARAQRNNARAAQSRALAGQAVASLDTDPGAGVELALEARRVWKTAEADAALRAALSADLLRSTPERRRHPINSARFDADSKRMVTTADDGKVVVWGVPRGQRLHDLPLDTAVNDAAFQPKGPLVAIAPDDGVVRLWKPADGSVKELEDVKEPKEKRAVASVVFNRDGTLLVSTSNDGRARLWKVAGRALPRILGDFGPPVTHAAFSPDGDRVLTAGEEGKARIWRVRDAKLLRTLDHGVAINDAEFSRNGRLVVTSGGVTAKIWSLDSKQPPKILTHSRAVATALFDRDGNVLTASRDGTARLWEIASGRVGTLSKHTGPLDAAAFSPNGKLVVTASEDGTARIWDVESGRSDYTLGGHSGAVTIAAFSPDGKHVITAAGDGSTRIWDAPADTVRRTLGGTGKWTSAAFNAKGTRVVTASKDGKVRIWRVSGGKLVQTLCLRKPGKHGRPCKPAPIVESAAFNPKGTRVVTASADGKARIWLVSAGKPMQTLSHGKPCKPGRPCKRPPIVESAAFNPKGTRVVTTSRDGNVRIWRVGSTAAPVTIPYEGALLNNAVFSPNGARVVTASDDGIATIRKASGGRPLHILRSVGAVADAEFSPGGTLVVTANGDWTARIWNVDDERIQTTLRGHEGPVRSAMFSRDGKLVVTASEDGTARVWDVVSGYAIATLHGHTGAVAAAAFSPDDKTLVVTADEDGRARIWKCEPCEMSPADLRKLARARIAASRPQ